MLAVLEAPSERSQCVSPHRGTADHGKGFDFYSRCGGKPLEGLMEG